MKHITTNHGGVMSRQIDPLKTRLRALLTAALCCSGVILCGNSACDSIGDYEGKERDMGVDMSAGEDMAREPDMSAPVDMSITRDMSAPIDMSVPADQGIDMRGAEDMAGDMAAPGMSCDRVSDCEQAQTNVVASCNGVGICSYVCSSEDFAVTDGEDIAVDGCTCEVEEEICDGRDNDCDGDVDEGLTTACVEQRGVCAGAVNICTGVPATFNDQCEEDRYVEHGSTTKMAYTSNVQEDFRCDGLDNDCDGTPDEACCSAGVQIHRTAPTAEISGRGYFSFLSPDRRVAGKLEFWEVFRSADRLSWKVSNMSEPRSNPRTIPSSGYTDNMPSCNNIQSIISTTTHKAQNPKLITAETCVDQNSKLKYRLFESDPSSPNTTSLVSEELSWSLNSLPVDTRHDTFLLTTDYSRVLISGWNQETSSDYKLEWCVSPNPTIDCKNVVTSQNITSPEDEHPPMLSADIEETTKKIIIGFFDRSETNALNDTERLIEISSNGVFIDEHTITLPSVVGGKRHNIDQQVAWIDPTTVLIAQLAIHTTSMSNKIYLSTYSLATKSVVSSIAISAPEYVGEKMEIELSLSKENGTAKEILLFALKPEQAQLWSTRIPANLSAPTAWETVLPGGYTLIASKMKLTRFNGVLTMNLLEGPSLNSIERLSSSAPNGANKATTYFFSREGLPLCDLDVDLPAP